MIHPYSPYLLLLFTALPLTLSTPATPRSGICPVRLPDPPSNPDVTPPQIDAFSSVRQPRIINGDLVSENLLPYIVFVVIGGSNISNSNDSSSCTGTLISSQWVLTAAHCVKGNENDVVVYTGLRQARNVSRQRRHVVQDSFVHPNFDEEFYLRPEAITFDIAVLRLATPAQGKFMRVNVDRSLPSQEEFARSVGYGLSRHICDLDQDDSDKPIELPEEARLLRQVDVPIVEQCECWRRNRASPVGVLNNYMNILCVGYRERTCSASFGDSGGPLLRYRDGEPIVVGVTSFGGTCALDNLPVAYIRTSSFEDWFDELGVEYAKVSGLDVPKVSIICEDEEVIEDIRRAIRVNLLWVILGCVLVVGCMATFFIVTFTSCCRNLRSRTNATVGREEQQDYNQILGNHADGIDPNSQTIRI